MISAPNTNDDYKNSAPTGRLARATRKLISSSRVVSAIPLPAVVMVALQVRLMVARWLLEAELTQRAQASLDWLNCPTAGVDCTRKDFRSGGCWA